VPEYIERCPSWNQTGETAGEHNGGSLHRWGEMGQGMGIPGENLIGTWSCGSYGMLSGFAHRHWVPVGWRDMGENTFGSVDG